MFVFFKNNKSQCPHTHHSAHHHYSSTRKHVIGYIIKNDERRNMAKDTRKRRPLQQIELWRILSSNTHSIGPPHIRCKILLPTKLDEHGNSKVNPPKILTKPSPKTTKFKERRRRIPHFHLVVPELKLRCVKFLPFYM